MEHISIPAPATKIIDEDSAYRLLEDWRWNGEPVCPHCGSTRKPYFLTPKASDGRKTRHGTVTPRRVWKCAEPTCRKQFSVLTGTVMHGSHIPVHKWLFVVFEMAASKNGVSAKEISRKYTLTNKSAWFMMQRIREAMKEGPLADMF